MTQIRVAMIGVLTLGLLVLCGCARPIGTVKGKVAYAGKALKGGSVMLVSTEGRQNFAAAIQEDGTYTIPNALSGDYKVCVDTSNMKPPTTSGGYSNVPQPKSGAAPKKGKSLDPGTEVPEGYKPSSPADAAAAANAKRYVEIPLKYKDSDKTDLSYTVVAGDQTFDIDLK